MRDTYKHIFLAAVSAAALAAAAEEPAATPEIRSSEIGFIVDGTVATVNGEAVTISEARSILALQVELMSKTPGFSEKSREEVFNEAMRRGADDLINRRLVIQSYRAGTARIPEGSLEKERERIIETRYKGDAALLRADLEHSRLTYDDWKKQVEEQMIVSSMRQAVVLDNINVSPNEIRKEYEARKDEFASDAKPRVFIYAVEADENADAALAAFARRLADGESFEALAKESSVDAMAERGGDYGWIDPDEFLAPALARTVRGLADGELSAPVPLGSRMYLVLRKAPRSFTLAEAMERVGAELREREGRRIHDAWLERLRAAASIKYHLPDIGN